MTIVVAYNGKGKSFPIGMGGNSESGGSGTTVVFLHLCTIVGTTSNISATDSAIATSCLISHSSILWRRHLNEEINSFSPIFLDFYLFELHTNSVLVIYVEEWRLCL